MVIQEFERGGRRVIIRPVTAGDAEAMLAIVRGIAEEGQYFIVEPPDLRSVEAQRERLAKVDPGEECFVGAEVDGVLAGFADAKRGTFAKTRHTAGLGIGLSPAFRNMGLGPLLMETLEAWAQSVGVKKLYLGVFSTNERARRMYERIGYQVEGVQRGQFLINGGYVDEILMAKWV